LILDFKEYSGQLHELLDFKLYDDCAGLSRYIYLELNSYLILDFKEYGGQIHELLDFK